MTRSQLLALTAVLPLASALFATAASAAGRAAPIPAKDGELARAAAVAQEFYDFHFHHDMAFTVAGVKSRESWFEPGFYQLLLAEAGKPVSPEAAPLIEGDPFTDSQEYPQSFRIGEVHRVGDRVSVQVVVVWPTFERSFQVMLVPHGTRWLIADLRYDPKHSLRGLLEHGD
ncbi:MAG TPA: hypothetical protein VOA87_23355 [Thermoanaerobaculia bacterium]|nr:hypothetical protein [Thermoanaerobaculia bacterium]